MMSARWCTVLYRTVLRTSNTSKCLTPVRRCRLLHVVARLRPIGSVAGGARPCLIWGARGGCCPPVRLALGDRRDLPVVRWGRWWHLDPRVRGSFHWEICLSRQWMLPGCSPSTDSFLPNLRCCEFSREHRAVSSSVTPAPTLIQPGARTAPPRLTIPNHGTLP